MTARSISSPVICLLLVALSHPVKPAECDAVLQLDYRGALLLLDEEKEAYRDHASLAVKPGPHTLTLYLPTRDTQWLPPVIARPITLADGESLAIRPEGVHYLYISSMPSGAEVRINGSAVGDSPLAISIITPTDSTITLTKEGFTPRTLSLEETLVQGPHLIVVLDPLAGHGMSPMATDAHNGSNHDLPGWLPAATLAYFIASTATGFYFKAQADGLYEDYLSTASVDRMNELFERAETMDDRARLFWVTGQISLGTTIYFFIQNFRSRPDKRPAPAIPMGLSPRGGEENDLSFPRVVWKVE